MSEKTSLPEGSIENVVPLRTRAEREAEAVKQYDEEANAEALAMLSQAIVQVHEGRAVGVAIAFTFADGSYGSLIPEASGNFGGLLAAVADCQYRLLKSSNGGG